MECFQSFCLFSLCLFASTQICFIERRWHSVGAKERKLHRKPSAILNYNFFIQKILAVNFRPNVMKCYYVMELIFISVGDFFVLIQTTDCIINPRDLPNTQGEEIFQFSASNTFPFSWKLISWKSFSFSSFYIIFLLLPWREEWNWLNQFLCGKHACSRNSENFCRNPDFISFSCANEA